MKTSELIQFLVNLPENTDPEVVTGEEWLPEQLINASFDGNLVNLHFDNAPEEDAGEIEARGFVEHEITMIKDKIVQLMFETNLPPKTKAEILLKLIVVSHENNSDEVLEVLNNPANWQSN
ncbi:hypothetical protein R3X26_00195 [Vibrio sp. TH_r3]|uniref:hypothetical protein n=1 Tax=Vibrio sp. TH_r3 TaxID=3082084 RepID=UPI00295433F2|nr:hypothetical protein [Vibrio sp. TH_r3]MDV7102820.1 hypothetical protein [Vibrio sp. TH_r3]